MTPRQLRDRSMKGQGWTHRVSNLTAKPYLKLFSEPVKAQQSYGKGATFTNEEQQFYFLLWDKVTEL